MYQQTGRGKQERGGKLLFIVEWCQLGIYRTSILMLTSSSLSLFLCQSLFIMFFILPASLPQSQWCSPRQWWSQKCSMCLENSSVETQTVVWAASKDTSAWEDPEFKFKLRVVLFLSPESRRPWSWGHTRRRREQWRLCSGASVQLHMVAVQSNTENTKMAEVTSQIKKWNIP